LKTKYDSLPFWSPVNWEGFEGRLFHLNCSGEIEFRKKRRSHSIRGVCNRCGESWTCDERTLQRQFGFAKQKRVEITRAELIKELRERPLYPEGNVRIEGFDFGDEPIIVKFGGGAMMTRNPNQPPPPIIGVYVHGHFIHLKKKPPKELLVTKFGGVKGKRTRPPPINK